MNRPPKVRPKSNDLEVGIFMAKYSFELKGSMSIVGEVEQVVINGQSYVSKGTMVPYDAEIIVTYHLKLKVTISDLKLY